MVHLCVTNVPSETCHKREKEECKKKSDDKTNNAYHNITQVKWH